MATNCPTALTLTWPEELLQTVDPINPASTLVTTPDRGMAVSSSIIPVLVILVNAEEFPHQCSAKASEIREYQISPIKKNL